MSIFVPVQQLLRTATRNAASRGGLPHGFVPPGSLRHLAGVAGPPPNVGDVGGTELTSANALAVN